MLIANIYDPLPPQGSSAEENILSSGLKDLYDEIKCAIFDTKVVISPLKTVRGSPKKTKGETAAIGLAESLNKAFKIALESSGWRPLQSPGSEAQQSVIDWHKSKPSGRAYGQEQLGIGLEIQFGNNYQFNEDIKRLSETFLGGYIVAGVSIVPSDSLALHKADRGAFFSDAKSKLDRYLESLASAQARRFPPIAILAVQHDEYNNDPYGYFELQAIKLSKDSRGLVSSAPATKLTNADEQIIKRRRQTKKSI